MEYKEHPQPMGKPLSACLLNGKMQNGDPGPGAKAPMSICGGEGPGRGAMGGGGGQVRHMGAGGQGRCTKEGVIGEIGRASCRERVSSPV